MSCVQATTIDCRLYISSCPVLELTSVPRRWWYNSQERYVDCVTECLWSCMVLWHSMLVLGHLLMVTVPVHYNCQSCTGLPCHIVVLALHQVSVNQRTFSKKRILPFMKLVIFHLKQKSYPVCLTMTSTFPPHSVSWLSSNSCATLWPPSLGLSWALCDRSINGMCLQSLVGMLWNGNRTLQLEIWCNK